MSQRKLRRKNEEGGAPNLRLVPPLEPARKSRRRWKLPRELRRIRKPKSNPVLEAYEEGLVLAALADGGASAKSLCEREPGRWNRGPLLKTLKRLHAKRKVQRLNRTHTVRTVYIINKEAPRVRSGR